AGGSWSPIGDVTTTMLWIGGKVTAPKLMENIFIPSVVCIGLPTLIASFLKPFKGNFALPEEEPVDKHARQMLYIGLSMIILVPILKTVAEVPPYMGMMFSLAIVTAIAEIKHRRRLPILSLESANTEKAGADVSGQERESVKIEREPRV